MADEVQTGKATIHGIRSSGTALGISGSDSILAGYATFIWDTLKAGHKWDTEFIKDEKNFDAAAVATNAHIELDVMFTPAGTSRSDVATKAAFVLPNAKVTLSGFESSDFNGDYLLLSDHALDLSQKQAKMSLKLRKYDDDAQNASMTTTVSG